jgi:hypothetical protein
MPCWKNKVLQLEHGMSQKVPPLSPMDNNTLVRSKVIQKTKLESESPSAKEGRPSIALKDREEGKKERKKGLKKNGKEEERKRRNEWKEARRKNEKKKKKEKRREEREKKKKKERE